MVVAEDFAMPTVGFTTVVDAYGLGLGTLGLEGTVRVSAVAGTGPVSLVHCLKEKYWIGGFVGTPQMWA